MDPKTVFEPFGATIGESLDRLEVRIGRIGFNSREEALSILRELDDVAGRLEHIQNEATRRQNGVHFDSLIAKLRSEAGAFLRDLGGMPALQQAREAVQPPASHEWWYLDVYLLHNRKEAVRRTLTSLGVAAAVLAVLALVYHFFLAPDAATAGRYRHENAARDAMINGEFDLALAEVDQGLTFVPDDPTLLALRGVILETQGQAAQAEESFRQAQQGLPDRSEFLITRGQAYLMVNNVEKALADSEEALEGGPRTKASAYLLAGQAYETDRRFQEALAAYNLAFDAADQNKQTELAAVSRTKMAMLIQVMNSQFAVPEEELTPEDSP